MTETGVLELLGEEMKQKSILICSPGRSGMHWLARILRGALGLAQSPHIVCSDVETVADRHLYMTHQYLSEWLPHQRALPFIVMVRDPRDQIVSVAYYVLGRDGNQWQKTDPKSARFQETLTRLKRIGYKFDWFLHYFQVRAGIPHYLVRYEDLHGDTRGVMQKLLLWLGAEVSLPLLDQAIERASFLRISGGRQVGEENTGHFYRKGIVGDWRNYFTPEENTEFCHRHSAIMSVLGYGVD